MLDDKNDGVVKDIHRMYALIDVKSSSLLTHVSLMIAACAFLYDSAGKNTMFFDGTPSTYVRKSFIIEAFVYILIALALLCCLGVSMYNAPNDKTKYKEYYARSIRTRATVYVVALRAARVATIAVIISTILKACNQ